MKCNYHTHTARCHHAAGTDRDYAEAAVQAGFDVLGFADHAPWPYPSYVSPTRMTMSEYPAYLSAIGQLKKEYAGMLTIHVGLECEYFLRYPDHPERLLELGADYLILGQHYIDTDEEYPYMPTYCVDDDTILRCAESTVRAIRTGLYAYVCHPDLYLKRRTDAEFNNACEQAADMICQAALEARMPLEYNQLGMVEGVGYPSGAFWKYARKWNNEVILGVDAHKPEHLLREDIRAKATRTLADLEYHLIDRLPMDR